MKTRMGIVRWGLAAVMCLGAFVCMACNRVNNAGEQKTRKRVLTERRQVKYFKAIESSLACDIYFTQRDGAPSVKIVGTRHDIDMVDCSVNADGVLKIGSKGVRGILNGGFDGDMKIYLSSPDLVSIGAYGAGDLKVLSALDTDTLRVCLNGTGDIDFERSVDCDEMYVTLKGSGDADFETVRAQKVDMQVYGVGDIDAKLVKVPMVNLLLKGTGDIEAELDRCGAVSGSLYGVGNIELKGTAASFTSLERGTGRIDDSQLSVRKGGQTKRVTIN